MRNISKHSSYSEGTRTSTGVDNTPNDAQLENMRLVAKNIFEPTRKALGDKPIKINSFFRSIHVNKAVGGAHKLIKGKYVATSQHCRGQAIDVDCIESTNAEIFFYILDNLDFDQLIWEKGDEKNPDWVHFSYKASANRKQALVLRNGSYFLFDESLCERPSKKEAAPKKKRILKKKDDTKKVASEKSPTKEDDDKPKRRVGRSKKK